MALGACVFNSAINGVFAVFDGDSFLSFSLVDSLEGSGTYFDPEELLDLFLACSSFFIVDSFSFLLVAVLSRSSIPANIMCSSYTLYRCISGVGTM